MPRLWRARATKFSVNVRMGQVETLKESGSRGLGCECFWGKRSASTSTSDLTAEGIRQLVDGAMALVNVTEEDAFSGLRRRRSSARFRSDLHLYDEDVYSLPGPERIEWARRAEAAALEADPRITNSDGGSLTRPPDARRWRTRALCGDYRSSYAGVSVAPLAQDAKWRHAARRLVVERAAAGGFGFALRLLARRRRGVRFRRLGARRVPTQRVPIVFAPEVARSLIGSVFEAASGDSIWRGLHFWPESWAN